MHSWLLCNPSHCRLQQLIVTPTLLLVPQRICLLKLQGFTDAWHSCLIGDVLRMLSSKQPLLFDTADAAHATLLNQTNTTPTKLSSKPLAAASLQLVGQETDEHPMHPIPFSPISPLGLVPYMMPGMTTPTPFAMHAEPAGQDHCNIEPAADHCAPGTAPADSFTATKAALAGTSPQTTVNKAGMSEGGESPSAAPSKVPAEDGGTTAIGAQCIILDDRDQNPSMTGSQQPAQVLQQRRSSLPTGQLPGFLAAALLERSSSLEGSEPTSRFMETAAGTLRQATQDMTITSVGMMTEVEGVSRGDAATDKTPAPEAPAHEHSATTSAGGTGLDIGGQDGAYDDGDGLAEPPFKRVKASNTDGDLMSAHVQLQHPVRTPAAGMGQYKADMSRHLLGQLHCTT